MSNKPYRMEITNNHHLDIKKLLILFLLCFVSPQIQVFSQTIFEPIQNPIYNYLERISSKVAIQYSDVVSPITRGSIYVFLKEIKTNKDRLNKLEKKELNCYLEEFNDIIRSVSKFNRFATYYYSNSNFILNLNPIIKIGYNQTGNFNAYFYAWGARLTGKYSDWFGAFLDFTDNAEIGEAINRKKFLTSETGYWNNKTFSNRIEYSDVKAGITIAWKWGNVSLLKDYFQWGSGKYGNLIHSTKSSSYPHIKLELHPTEWLSFRYVHGWLNSNIPDSIYYYPTTREHPDGETIFREKYKDKYFAANLLTISPAKFFEFSLGNAVIYEYPSPKPEYLIPFNLFKFQDHNAGRDNNFGNNGQIFVDFVLRYPTEFKFYSSFFLENASISEILDGDWAKTWFGYTLGFTKVNMFLDNFDFNIEYTKINPWVYEHYIPTLTYKHIDHELGHWIGQNADLLRIQIDSQPLFGLHISLFYEYVRKGGLRDLDYAFDKFEDEFLYGPLRTDSRVGFLSSYEIFHRLFVKFSCHYSEISDEDNIRTSEYLLGSNISIFTSVQYGF